jgi:hypothetical protein
LPILQALRRLPVPFSLSLLSFAVLVPPSHAQATPDVEIAELGGITAAATTNDSGPAGIVPYVRGFNASIGTSSQHDSSDGWSSELSPTVAYRLNKYFSADASALWYMYINIDANVGTKAKPVFGYTPEKAVFGDTTLSAHLDVTKFTIGYNATVSMGLPSGNTAYGLGAGQVTYNFNNHFEKRLGIFTPDIEMGYGDTSNLIDSRVTKSYISVGPLAHFQAGTSVDLPWNMSFEADAYEELPLAKNIVYSTTGKGKKKVTTSTNEDPAEDNGFITSLDIPISRHVIMSGFYDRSLIDHDDIGGFSFTFLLRAAPRAFDLAF